ncbi:MAG: protein-disulfide reductase DsbD [bacterium]|nr:protein-disulfide reductase DsbD [bacterium]
MKRIIYCFLLSFSIIFPIVAFSEPIPIDQFDPEKDISVSFQPKKLENKPIDTLLIQIHVPKGYHITSIDNGFFFVQVKEQDGFHFQNPIYPNPVSFEGEKVFQGLVKVKIPFQLPTEIKKNKFIFDVTVGYQICAEFGAKTCFMPVERALNWSVELIKITNLQVQENKHEEPTKPDTTIIQQPLTENTIQATQVSKNNSSTSQSSLENRFVDALQKGSVIAFLLVFLGGILASLTPCVYPIIPITMGYIGSKSGGKKLRGFTLSLAFVLGLAIIYSLLGLFAASTGALFGAFTQTPVFLAIIGTIIAVMGISMLGVFDIPIPGFAAEAQANPKGGYWGAILMGGLSGLVAAPCVGPILVALLAWVAKTGSMVLGFFLLFTFSMGMGLLFIVIGTFSGLLQSLPKAGEWMVAIKKAFGIAMIAGAVFIVRSILPETIYHLAWALILAFTAILLWGKPIQPEDELSIGIAFRRALALIAAVLAILFLTSSFPIGIASKQFSNEFKNAESIPSPKSEMAWKINQEEQVFNSAKQNNKRILIDFYADWCAACVELDHYTWVDPKVQSAVSDYELLKFDFTKQSQQTKELMKKYNILGLPTVLVLDPNGKELSRFTGFKSANEFLTWLESVQ